MSAYSNDLRKRIIQRLEAGEKVKTVAEMFEVGLNCVYTLLRRYKKTGSYEALPSGGGRPSKLSESDIERLREIVQKHPDATLEELREMGCFAVSRATLCRVLNSKLKLVRKKNTSCS